MTEAAWRRCDGGSQTTGEEGWGGSCDSADSRRVFESNTQGTSDYYYVLWDREAARAAGLTHRVFAALSVCAPPPRKGAAYFKEEEGEDEEDSASHLQMLETSEIRLDSSIKSSPCTSELCLFTTLHQ